MSDLLVGSEVVGGSGVGTGVSGVGAGLSRCSLCWENIDCGRALVRASEVFLFLGCA